MSAPASQSLQRGTADETTVAQTEAGSPVERRRKNGAGWNRGKRMPPRYCWLQRAAAGLEPQMPRGYRNPELAAEGALERAREWKLDVSLDHHGDLLVSTTRPTPAAVINRLHVLSPYVAEHLRKAG